MLRNFYGVMSIFGNGPFAKQLQSLFGHQFDVFGTIVDYFFNEKTRYCDLILGEDASLFGNYIVHIT